MQEQGNMQAAGPGPPMAQQGPIPRGMPAGLAKSVPEATGLQKVLNALRDSANTAEKLANELLLRLEHPKDAGAQVQQVQEEGLPLAALTRIQQAALVVDTMHRANETLLRIATLL